MSKFTVMCSQSCKQCQALGTQHTECVRQSPEPEEPAGELSLRLGFCLGILQARDPVLRAGCFTVCVTRAPGTEFRAAGCRGPERGGRRPLIDSDRLGSRFKSSSPGSSLPARRPPKGALRQPLACAPAGTRAGGRAAGQAESRTPACEATDPGRAIGIAAQSQEQEKAANLLRQRTWAAVKISREL